MKIKVISLIIAVFLLAYWFRYEVHIHPRSLQAVIVYDHWMQEAWIASREESERFDYP